MRNALLLVTVLGLFGTFALAGSTPTAPPPVEELVLAGFPPVSVEDLIEGAQPRTKAIEHVSPEKFTNLIIEPKCTCAVDFGALSGTANAAVPSCRESSACACTGAVIGDVCFASTTYGADDGGTVLPAESFLSCRVTVANQVLFKLCNPSTDAGSLDPGAGLFTARLAH